MKIRPLDGNGDIMPVTKLEDLIEGAPAVSQVITMRMQLLYGEWWEDPELGFRVPEFLAGNARSGDVDLLAKYIASYVSDTQNVMGVENVSAVYSSHRIVFYCLAVTDEGESSVVEVDVDGIL